MPRSSSAVAVRDCAPTESGKAGRSLIPRGLNSRARPEFDICTLSSYHHHDNLDHAMTVSSTPADRRDAAKREAERLTMLANELFESRADPDLIDAAFVAADAANAEYRALNHEVFEGYRLARARAGTWPTASAWDY